MATLNRKTHPAHSVLTTHEGAPAKRINAVQELRRSVLACLLWESQFYESGEDIAARVTRLAEDVAPQTVADLAVEARDQQHLRHVPLLLCAALAKRGGRIVAETLAHVIQRPDELTEFLAIYWKDGKTPLSAQVKRGLAAAFPKFDAYQLAKYNRDGAIKLRDVLFLCHAKPKDDEQAATWKRLVDGTLPAPDTWEVALSAGQDKRGVWTRLLTEKKLGGLALLRNLRNMEQAGVESGLVRQGIAGGKFGRVLPFRFIAAARHAPKYEPELEAAMLGGLADMPKLGGRSAIVVDVSGSMDAALSGRSEMSRKDAAAGVAIILRELCDSVVVVAFGMEAAIVPARRGFALRDAIAGANVGHATFMEKGKQLADREGYDRIIVISDEQGHGYHGTALSNPNGRGYVVNVASYQRGVGYGDWTHIDGWSESVVRYIQAVEQDAGTRPA